VGLETDFLLRLSEEELELEEEEEREDELKERDTDCLQYLYPIVYSSCSFNFKALSYRLWS
jgi:hypothetical protein